MEVYIMFTDDYEIHSHTFDNCECLIDDISGFIGLEYYDEDGIPQKVYYPNRYIYKIEINN